jgi:RimJ/RimL family protein N-acetyltransferase
MRTGWEGELVRLVPFDEAKHFENCVRWANDTDLTRTLGFGDYPMSREAQREWWDRTVKATDTNIVFAIETLDGVHIGTSGIHQISQFHKTAMTGSYIALEEYRGKGYGTDAARVRTRYCFEVLGLRQIYSGYLEGNDASRRMSEKIGAKVWGVKPKALWKRGRYVDEVFVYTTPEMFEAALAQK